MGSGMLIQVIVMIVAMLVEFMRLDVIKQHHLEGNKKAIVPRSIFTFIPQFALMGMADALLDIGKIDFFYDQASENMQNLGISLFTSSHGVGTFTSSLLLIAVTSMQDGVGDDGFLTISMFLIWITIMLSLLFYYFSTSCSCLFLMFMPARERLREPWVMIRRRLLRFWLSKYIKTSIFVRVRVVGVYYSSHLKSMSIMSFTRKLFMLRGKNCMQYSFQLLLHLLGSLSRNFITVFLRLLGVYSLALNSCRL